MWLTIQRGKVLYSLLEWDQASNVLLIIVNQSIISHSGKIETNKHSTVRMKAYSQEFVARETTHNPLQVTDTQTDDEHTKRLMTIIIPVIIAAIVPILCMTCCCIQRWNRRRRFQFNFGKCWLFPDIFRCKTESFK